MPLWGAAGCTGAAVAVAKLLSVGRGSSAAPCYVTPLPKHASGSRRIPQMSDFALSVIKQIRAWAALRCAARVDFRERRKAEVRLLRIYQPVETGFSY